MFKDFIETIRNKLIQRLIKKTHLWQTTQIEFLQECVRQEFGCTKSLHHWLEEIEKQTEAESVSLDFETKLWYNIYRNEGKDYE